MNEKNIQILIVEDEWINSQFIKKVLFQLGFHNIYAAANHEDAQQIVKTNTIDLIFMDINIDGPIDGITSAHKLNQFYAIPIIYITAYYDTQTIEEATKTNLYGYMIKPFTEKDIEATLNVTLKRLEKAKTEQEPKAFINLGNGYKYNHELQVLLEDKSQISLTKKEKQIIDLLCTNISGIVSFEEFRSKVWEGKEIANSTIRDTILRVRKKAPRLNIENISGHGYIILPNP